MCTGVWWGKPDEKEPLGRIMHRWEDNINPLTPNDHHSGHTAPLTSKRCILYIYAKNIGAEYFKHGTYSPFFSLENAVCFIILTYFVPVLFKFYIQGVLKLKKNNPGAKTLTWIFRNWDRRAWTELIWLRIETYGGHW